ncbi:YodC family protein [Pseudorhodoplanes sp.]|uniref:YodC family protein n=1 Tax=Pseudorhodoplanes sp. TaxID=1934341 RepID=UPI003D11659B
MIFQLGDIVTLKSGGPFMTVSLVNEDGVEFIWIGEEGDFFRETVPAAVLRSAESADDEAEATGNDDGAEEQDRQDELETRRSA